MRVDEYIGRAIGERMGARMDGEWADRQADKCMGWSEYKCLLRCANTSSGYVNVKVASKGICGEVCR